MIIELFAKAVSTVLTWIIGLIPAIAVPEWLSTAADKVQWMLDQAADFSYWVPLQTAATVGIAVMACLGVGLGFKLVRVILSAFTGGGGSAG